MIQETEVVAVWDVAKRYAKRIAGRFLGPDECESLAGLVVCEQRTNCDAGRLGDEFDFKAVVLSRLRERLMNEMSRSRPLPFSDVGLEANGTVPEETPEQDEVRRHRKCARREKRQQRNDLSYETPDEVVGAGREIFLGTDEVPVTAADETLKELLTPEMVVRGKLTPQEIEIAGGPGVTLSDLGITMVDLAEAGGSQTFIASHFAVSPWQARKLTERVQHARKKAA